MNKIECKKYLKRAYKRLKVKNKSITPKNIEDEMVKVISKQALEYVSYAKIATYNMLNSANKNFGVEDLLEEIDVIGKIYSKDKAFEKAKNL